MSLGATKKDYIWNYIGTLFRMGSTLIIVPVLIYFLSGDLLGLWYSFGAASGLVLTFQSGFAPTFARNVSYCWSGARNLTKEGIDRALSSSEICWPLFFNLIEACKSVYRRIAIIVSIVLSTLGTAYIIYIGQNLSLYHYLPAWLIYCLAAFLNVYFTYYESLLRGVGDFPDINIATVVSSSLNLILSIGMLALGFGLLSCAISYLIQGLSFRLICRSKFYKFKNIKENYRHYVINKNEAKRLRTIISYNAFKDTAVSLANYAVTSSSTILCSLFLDLTTTGYYSVALQVVNASVNLSNVMLSTNLPSLQSSFVNRDIDKQQTLMATIITGLLAVYILTIVLAFLLMFPLFTYIKPGFSFDPVVVVLLAAYMLLWKQHSACAVFIASSNELPYVRSFIVSSISGIALSSVFVGVFHWGIVGIIAGQALAQLVYNNWKWPKVASSRVNLSYLSLLKLGFTTYYQKVKNFINHLKSRGK